MAAADGISARREHLVRGQGVSTTEDQTSGVKQRGASRRGRHRASLAWRWLVAVLLSSALVGGSFAATRGGAQAGVGPVDLSGVTWPKAAVAGPPAPKASGKALILYDSVGEYGPLAKVYATMAGDLASHFAHPVVQPVGRYRGGEISGYRAVVYVGVVEGEALPADFLTDVVTTAKPVMWLGANADQLVAAAAAHQRRLGWRSDDNDNAAYTKVTYKGTVLSRNADAAGTLVDVVQMDSQTARTLAVASATSGRKTPWAVRSGNVTYVAEVPLDAEDVSTDRYLALTDLMFDLFGTQSRPRHRALLRLEDIGPNSDPAQLARLAQLLSSRHVPYSFALYPVYRDEVTAHPRRTIYLYQRPEMVRVVAYMLTHAGTMVLHGLTHQFGDLRNPLNGQSASDFEFFRVHKAPDGVLVYDGPVPGDSEAWARQRMQAAIDQVTRTGLPRPELWEFPHYGASVADYAAAKQLFSGRYDRPQLFSTAWHGGPLSPYMFDQYAPYVTQDVYGSTVTPENLGYVDGPPVPAKGVGSLADIVSGARANLVVRDGIASFFFHPYLGTDRLTFLLDQFTSLGYTFVSPSRL